MPSPNFAVRSEYRAPNRAAFNAVGTEGCRAPGNIPRQYGMLNAEIGKFGLNIPYPDSHVFSWKDRVPMHGWESPKKEQAIVASPSPPSYTSDNVGWLRY